MIESLNETVGSYDFKIDKLCVNAGIEEDSSCDETVFSEAENFRAKYDDDYLPDEDQIELLQQKEFINSLFCERNCFNEVVFNNDQFAINADNDKLFLLNGQLKSDGQITKFVAEVEDQNYVLMTDENMVTTESLACEGSEYCTASFSKEMIGLWHELSVLE